MNGSVRPVRIGGSSVLGPKYITEIAPAKWRWSGQFFTLDHEFPYCADLSPDGGVFGRAPFVFFAAMTVL